MKELLHASAVSLVAWAARLERALAWSALQRGNKALKERLQPPPAA